MRIILKRNASIFSHTPINWFIWFIWLILWRGKIVESSALRGWACKVFMCIEQENFFRNASKV